MPTGTIVRNWLRAATFAGAALFAADASAAPTILLGFDTQTPVQMYTTGGAFLGNFGQNSATGSAFDGAGHVWTVAPNFGANRIVEYDLAQNPLNAFVATVGGQWIEDMAWGGANSLWAGTFEGAVWNIDATTGAVNSFFSVPNSSFTGVAFDGTNLWLGGGFTSNNIFRYSTAGVLLDTIPIGFGPGGIGYDRADNTLWVGSTANFGAVVHLDLNGNVLGGFSAGTFFHDGLEVGELQSTPMPEPASLTLLAVSLAGLAGMLRRRKKA